MLWFNRAAPIVVTSVVLPFFYRSVRAFPKYYHPGISNHYGFPAVVLSKIYSNIIVKTWQQKQQPYAAVTVFKNDVEHSFEKYFGFFDADQKRIPLFPRSGIITAEDKLLPIGLLDEASPEGKGIYHLVRRYRFLLTSLAVGAIHFIVVK